MKIHLFNDKTGVIGGYSPFTLMADKSGLLKIGNKVINILPDTPAKIPPLMDDTYNAVFESSDGITYDLGRITIHNGGVVASKTYTAREIELKHALDKAEDKIAELIERVDVLEHIFDTDSLNFLIPPENE